jgi:hypothetical protein
MTLWMFAFGLFFTKQGAKIIVSETMAGMSGNVT